MALSYLGTAQNSELMLWVLESEHAAQFLQRRIRRTPHAVAFWAVVPNQVGGQIGDLLASGHRVAATALLKAAATDCGHILPSFDQIEAIDQRAWRF